MVPCPAFTLRCDGERRLRERMIVSNGDGGNGHNRVILAGRIPRAETCWPVGKPPSAISSHAVGSVAVFYSFTDSTGGWDVPTT
jgi:hypothetical protein